MQAQEHIAMPPTLTHINTPPTNPGLTPACANAARVCGVYTYREALEGNGSAGPACVRTPVRTTCIDDLTSLPPRGHATGLPDGCGHDVNTAELTRLVLQLEKRVWWRKGAPVTLASELVVRDKRAGINSGQVEGQPKPPLPAARHGAAAAIITQ